ncbi:hypothetical protein ACIQVL_46675 [Streptomyces sp. NPDC090499]|uniref:hypothetical protein n=1 Tax=unclassified Streptomyces TaxID=2593676 RepID=UPI00381A350E
MRGLKLAAVALTVLASLAAGCAHDAGTPQKAAATPTGVPAGAPSGYPEMQQKADAAESALTQADKDAARDDTDR